MKLCLDAGNTRLKWAVADTVSGAESSVQWVANGVCYYPDLSHTVKALLQQYPQIESVALSNVAGGGREHEVQQAIGSLSLLIIQSSELAGGVVNGYLKPETLGVDRWCGLVAAWYQQRGACLVVSLGTATTVDALDATGRFLGGLILPGVTLMRASLAERTAQLPMVPDQAAAVAGWPRATDEAISAGSLDATVGAIQRAWHQLAIDKKTPPVCVLTGGAAEMLEPLLSAEGMPILVREHLVLEGVYLLASASSKSNT